MTVLRKSRRWQDKSVRPGGTSDDAEKRPSVRRGARRSVDRSNGSVHLQDAPPSLPRPKRFGRRIITKGRGKQWRTHYRLSVEIGLVLSLLVLAIILRAPLYRSGEGLSIQLAEQEVVTIEDIQQTKQIVKPPPPPPPPVPVEVANDAVLDDEELNLDVTLDITEEPAYIPPPPPPPPAEEPEKEAPDEIFVVVEQMPEIIGGIGKIYEYLEYPMIARQAMMEGLVVVHLVVEPDGTGSSPEVVKSAGQVLDEAALDAVHKLRFKPGMQRGKAVRVKMAIPIRFVLRERKN